MPTRFRDRRRSYSQITVRSFGALVERQPVIAIPTTCGDIQAEDGRLLRSALLIDRIEHGELLELIVE